MRLRKVERRILKPIRLEVANTRKLTRRAIDSHHRWTAMAAYPDLTPIGAVLRAALAKRNP